MQALYTGGVLKPVQPQSLPLAEGGLVDIAIVLPVDAATPRSFKGMWALTHAQAELLEQGVAEVRAESAARADDVAAIIAGAIRPAR